MPTIGKTLIMFCRWWVLMKRHCTPAVIFTACILLAGGCLAQAVAHVPSGREESLKKFLQKYDGSPASADEKTTRYTAAFVDLKDDGTEEAIVYLLGPRWCGSGGCSCLILVPEGSSFRVITKTTVTQPPIRVLSTKTNGWRDLAVGVSGGGIQPGYTARLRFNGRKYPGNPTVPPAQRLRKNAEGKVVISAETESYSALW